MHDDAFGVGEALNETAFGKGLVARGIHYLIVGSKQPPTEPTAEANERFLQLQKLIPNWLFFSDASKLTYDNWKQFYTNIVSKMYFSEKVRDLPTLTLSSV